MLVVFAALVLDIGWVLMMPSIGIPAMFVAIIAQAATMVSIMQTEKVCAPYEWALTFWILGGAAWMMSEYMFDDGGHPAGFLSTMDVLEGIDVAYYAPCMFVASLTLWATFASLMLFFTYKAFQTGGTRRQRRNAGNGDTTAEGAPESERGNTRSGIPKDLAGGIPIEVYKDLWFAPWLFMESCWVLCNLRMLRNEKLHLWFHLSVFGGLVAIALCVDCVQRHLARNRYEDAALSAAYTMWVSGNLVWSIYDIQGISTSWSQASAVCFFSFGLACVTYAARVGSNEDRKPLLSARP